MAGKHRKLVIAAIAGVTNGGKTTLCKALKEKYSAAAFHMDDYFWPEDSPNHVLLPEFNGHANWDCVQAVDFKRLHQDVLKWIDKTKQYQATSQYHAQHQTALLLIEGILVLSYKPLRDLCTLKYFFTLTKSECLERRKFRVYEPPDPEGYFDRIVWPMYLKSKDDLGETSDITVLSGTEDQNIVMDRISNEITKMLNQH